MDLDEGERLEKAATPGPWRKRLDESEYEENLSVVGPDYKDGDYLVKGTVAGVWMDGGGFLGHADRDLTIWLRNNAQALIAAARERDRLREFFRTAGRMGAYNDVPEGARYIQVSDTLANQIADGLFATDPSPVPPAPPPGPRSRS